MFLLDMGYGFNYQIGRGWKMAQADFDPMHRKKQYQSMHRVEIQRFYRQVVGWCPYHCPV